MCISKKTSETLYIFLIALQDYIFWIETDSQLNPFCHLCPIKKRYFLLTVTGLDWRFRHGFNRGFTWTLVGLRVAVSSRIPGITAVFARLCALWLSRPVIGKSPRGVIVKRCPWVISITRLKDTITLCYKTTCFQPWCLSSYSGGQTSETTLQI